MATTRLTIQVGGDDGNASSAGANFGSVNINVGSTSGTDGFYGIFRFNQTHNIPANATINSAVITLVASNTNGSSASFLWEAIANSNPTQIANFADYGTRTKTTGPITWNSNSSVTGTTYVMPDLRSVFQQLVGLSGWTTSSAMIFGIRNNTGSTPIRLFRAFESGSAYAVMDVDYGGASVMRNYYLGATISQPGASVLSSKALVEVQEGYQIGASTHYVSLGEYEVQNFSNYGPFNQTLSLDLASPLKRLSTNTYPLNKVIDQQEQWYDNFSDPTTFTGNYNPDNSFWGVTQDVLRVTNPTTASILGIANLTPAKDQRITIKFGSDDTSRCIPGIILRGTDLSEGSVSGYLTQYNGTNSNIEMYTFIGGTAILNAGTTVTIPNGTNYWLTMVARDQDITAFGSTDGMRYTQLFSMRDTTYSEGMPALRNGISGALFINFDDLEYTEINNIVNYGDVLDETLNIAGVRGVSVSNNFENFTGMTVIAGSSFVFGTSNNVFVVNRTGGTVWQNIFTSGLSLTDFVMEIEGRGNSGNYLGLGVGSTSLFYFNEMRLINTEGATYYNTVGRAGISGGNWFKEYRNGGGNYVFLQPNNWYNFKVVKNGTYLGFFVNNLLVNSIYGTSYSTTEFNGINAGIIAANYGSAGSTSEWRNLRMTSLPQAPDNVIFDNNVTLNSVFNRYLPDGYNINYSNFSANVFKIGLSQTGINIGDSYYYTSTSQELSNTEGFDSTSSKSGNYISTFNNTNTRVNSQFDSNRTEFINDQNNLGLENAQDLAINSNYINNKNIDTVSLDIIPRIRMENYDQINYSNNFLGISTIYLVYNFNKQYNASSGSFIQTVNMGL